MAFSALLHYFNVSTLIWMAIAALPKLLPPYMGSPCKIPESHDSEQRHGDEGNAAGQVKEFLGLAKICQDKSRPLDHKGQGETDRKHRNPATAAPPWLPAKANPMPTRMMMGNAIRDIFSAFVLGLKFIIFEFFFIVVGFLSKCKK